MEPHFILGIHITNRMQKAGEVQRVLSEYGCNIKTRIGLHDVSDTYCSPSGIVLLELVGKLETCLELQAKLAAVPGVEVQKMQFNH